MACAVAAIAEGFQVEGHKNPLQNFRYVIWKQVLVLGNPLVCLVAIKQFESGARSEYRWGFGGRN